MARAPRGKKKMLARDAPRWRRIELEFVSDRFQCPHRTPDEKTAPDSCSFSWRGCCPHLATSIATACFARCSVHLCRVHEFARRPRGRVLGKRLAEGRYRLDAT